MEKSSSYSLNFPLQWVKYTPDNLIASGEWEAFFEQLTFLKSLANIQPQDFRSQEEWEYFFDSLKNLKKAADKKNSLALKSAYYKTMRHFTSKAPKIPLYPAASIKPQINEEWYDFCTHLILLQGIISTNPQNLTSSTDWINFFEKITMLSLSSFKTGSVILKKAYLQTVRKIYPTYVMPPNAHKAALNRLQTVWSNLKDSSKFEEQLQKYTLGSGNEKREAIECLTQQIINAFESFHSFKKLNIIFYDNNTVNEDGLDAIHGYNVSFCVKGKPNKFYINVDDEQMEKTSAAEMVGIICHELTHLMQYDLMDKKSIQQKNYFDKDFISVLKAFYPVYENNVSLKKLRKELLIADIPIESNSQADIMSYYNNPMEQEAYFTDNIIKILTQNLLIDKGLEKENHTYDYRLANRFHFPYKSNQEVLNIFGEKENFCPSKALSAIDKKTLALLMKQSKESSL